MFNKNMVFNNINIYLFLFLYKGENIEWYAHYLRYQLLINEF